MTDNDTAAATTASVPAQIVVRLNTAERTLLATILMTMRDPRRREPTVSEAVRAALVTAAGTCTTRMDAT